METLWYMFKDMSLKDRVGATAVCLAIATLFLDPFGWLVPQDTGIVAKLLFGFICLSLFAVFYCWFITSGVRFVWKIIRHIGTRGRN